MPSKAIISIDAMGGDLAPRAVIAGVARAASQGLAAHFLIHGDRRELDPLLKEYPEAIPVSEVRHTETFVTMSDKPSKMLRGARGTSMWNAVTAVKSGEAQVALSAGNTGALMVISKVVLRMMANVHRPVIVANWPNPRGLGVVLDVGANVECDPRQLVEFAIMGEAYHRAVHGSARPTVGLLNVGAEEMKGNRIVKEADKLLRAAHLDFNYVGSVEGDDLSLGGADVIVTDGFTGNVALKTAEGTARLMAGYMREAFSGGVLAKLGALLSYGALQKLKARMDPNNVNGGVFLGLNGVVVKSHGGADAQGIATALRIATEMARSDFRSEVERNLERLAATDADADNGDHQEPIADTARAPTTEDAQ